MKRITSSRLDPYRRAVEAKICAVCNDRDVHGACARDPANPCSLDQHLDLIVDTVLSVGGSPEIDDYITAFRTRTCPKCRQDDEGFCALRRFGECATDSYVLMVVDVIEEVAKAQGHGKWAPGAAE